MILQIIVAQLIHDALNQVKALLVRKTGDDADHKRLLIHRKA